MHWRRRAVVGSSPTAATWWVGSGGCEPDMWSQMTVADPFLLGGRRRASTYQSRPHSAKYVVLPINGRAWADVIQGDLAPFLLRTWCWGTNARCACLQGSACSPPRRAGLAPRDTAEQATPDRPVHLAHCAGALPTLIQACPRHAVALAARRGSDAYLVFVAVDRSSVFPSPSSLIPRP